MEEKAAGDRKDYGWKGGERSAKLEREEQHDHCVLDCDGAVDLGSRGPSSAAGRPISLDIAQARRRDSRGEYLMEDKIVVQQETPVMVVFELPDGSTDEREFMMGQTVEVLKSYLQAEFDMPIHQQRLLVDGEPLIDPLSLLDYPTIRTDEELYIVVEGELGEGALK